MRGHPIFAALYDVMTRAVERGGLVRDASSRTLELGAGTGHDLPRYTDAVTELVLTEPDPHMARRLCKRLDAEPPPPPSVEVVEAPAELPFDRASDSVVSTLVLCSVDAPGQAVAGGCHPNRDTARALETAGFDTASLGRDRMPKTAPIVRPLVRGAVLRLASD